MTPETTRPIVWRSLVVIVVVGIAAVAIRIAPSAAREIREFKRERATATLSRERWASLIVGPRLGRGKEAPQAVVFTDYECEACKQFDDSLTVVLDRVQEASVVIRHLPSASHPRAGVAARAAVCIVTLGDLGRVHAILFDSLDALVRGDYDAIGRLVGVSNTGQWGRCIESLDAFAAVGADLSLGRELGLRATPAIVTPGRVQYGVLSTEALGDLLARGHR